MIFETLKVSREGPVLFVDIAVPPMNLLGPELVRDLVSLIQQAEADNSIRVRGGSPLRLRRPIAAASSDDRKGTAQHSGRYS